MATYVRKDVSQESGHDIKYQQKMREDTHNLRDMGHLERLQPNLVQKRQHQKRQHQHYYNHHNQLLLRQLHSIFPITAYSSRIATDLFQELQTPREPGAS